MQTSASAGANRTDIDTVAALRSRIETAAEALIALLDEFDAPAEDLEPDADGEDGGDWEPWLACPEHSLCCTDQKSGRSNPNSVWAHAMRT